MKLNIATYMTLRSDCRNMSMANANTCCDVANNNRKACSEEHLYAHHASSSAVQDIHREDNHETHYTPGRRTQPAICPSGSHIEYFFVST
jgi:hypothetical protein